MNTEKYHINLIIDDHKHLKYRFFDKISIWEEIKRFVPIFLETAIDLNCQSLNIYFNNFNSILNIKSKKEIDIVRKQLDSKVYYKNYSLHDTISIVFNNIIENNKKCNRKEYIVLITDNINKVNKLFENRQYIYNLKYIRVLLFSTKKYDKIIDPTIKVFNRNYILSDKSQTIFTLTS
jgi:hypothetical protein